MHKAATATASTHTAAPSRYATHTVDDTSPRQSSLPSTHQVDIVASGTSSSASAVRSGSLTADDDSPGEGGKDGTRARGRRRDDTENPPPSPLSSLSSLRHQEEERCQQQQQLQQQQQPQLSSSMHATVPAPRTYSAGSAASLSSRSHSCAEANGDTAGSRGAAGEAAGRAEGSLSCTPQQEAEMEKSATRQRPLREVADGGSGMEQEDNDDDADDVDGADAETQRSSTLQHESVSALQRNNSPTSASKVVTRAPTAAAAATLSSHLCLAATAERVVSPPVPPNTSPFPPQSPPQQQRQQQQQRPSLSEARVAMPRGTPSPPPPPPPSSTSQAQLEFSGNAGEATSATGEVNANPQRESEAAHDGGVGDGSPYVLSEATTAAYVAASLATAAAAAAAASGAPRHAQRTRDSSSHHHHTNSSGVIPILSAPTNTYKTVPVLPPQVFRSASSTTTSMSPGAGAAIVVASSNNNNNNNNNNNSSAVSTPVLSPPQQSWFGPSASHAGPAASSNNASGGLVQLSSPPMRAVAGPPPTHSTGLTSPLSSITGPVVASAFAASSPTHLPARLAYSLGGSRKRNSVSVPTNANLCSEDEDNVNSYAVDDGYQSTDQWLMLSQSTSNAGNNTMMSTAVTSRSSSREHGPNEENGATTATTTTTTTNTTANTTLMAMRGVNSNQTNYNSSGSTTINTYQPPSTWSLVKPQSLTDPRLARSGASPHSPTTSPRVAHVHLTSQSSSSNAHNNNNNPNIGDNSGVPDPPPAAPSSVHGATSPVHTPTGPAHPSQHHSSSSNNNSTAGPAASRSREQSYAQLLHSPLQSPPATSALHGPASRLGGAAGTTALLSRRSSLGSLRPATHDPYNAAVMSPAVMPRTASLSSLRSPSATLTSPTATSILHPSANFQNAAMGVSVAGAGGSGGSNANYNLTSANNANNSAVGGGAPNHAAGVTPPSFDAVSVKSAMLDSSRGGLDMLALSQSGNDHMTSSNPNNNISEQFLYSSNNNQNPSFAGSSSGTAPSARPMLDFSPFLPPYLQQLQQQQQHQQQQQQQMQTQQQQHQQQHNDFVAPQLVSPLSRSGHPDFISPFSYSPQTSTTLTSPTQDFVQLPSPQQHQQQQQQPMLPPQQQQQQQQHMQQQQQQQSTASPSFFPATAAHPPAPPPRRRTAQEALTGFFSDVPIELGDQTHLVLDRNGNPYQGGGGTATTSATTTPPLLPGCPPNIHQQHNNNNLTSSASNPMFHGNSRSPYPPLAPVAPAQSGYNNMPMQQHRQQQQQQGYYFNVETGMSSSGAPMQPPESYALYPSHPQSTLMHQQHQQQQQHPPQHQMLPNANNNNNNNSGHPARTTQSYGPPVPQDLTVERPSMPTFPNDANYKQLQSSSAYSYPGAAPCSSMPSEPPHAYNVYPPQQQQQQHSSSHSVPPPQQQQQQQQQQPLNGQPVNFTRVGPAPMSSNNNNTNGGSRHHGDLYGSAVYCTELDRSAAGPTVYGSTSGGVSMTQLYQTDSAMYTGPGQGGTDGNVTINNNNNNNGCGSSATNCYAAVPADDLYHFASNSSTLPVLNYGEAEARRRSSNVSGVNNNSNNIFVAPLPRSAAATGGAPVNINEKRVQHTNLSGAGVQQHYQQQQQQAQYVTSDGKAFAQEAPSHQSQTTPYFPPMPQQQQQQQQQQQTPSAYSSAQSYPNASWADADGRGRSSSSVEERRMLPQMHNAARGDCGVVNSGVQRSARRSSA